jgi:hypothetical protein
MGMQAIGGEHLHTEVVRMGNTVQAWIEDGRNITHIMLDQDQAAEIVRKIGEVLTYDLNDA